MTNGNDSAAVKTAAEFLIHQSRLSIEITLELDIFHQIGGVEPFAFHFCYIVGVDTTRLHQIEYMERDVIITDLVKTIDKIRGNPCGLKLVYPVKINVGITRAPESFGVLRRSVPIFEGYQFMHRNI